MKKPISILLTTFLIASFGVSLTLFDKEIVKPEELKRTQENRKNERTKPNAKSREGFTVQLSFTDDKDVAENMKRRFSNQFENKYPCTVEWHEPNFKVFAGSFLTKAEAVSLLYKVRGSFDNAMIVKTKI